MDERELSRIERENADADDTLRAMSMDMTRPPRHLDEAVDNVTALLAEVRRLKALIKD